MSICKCFFCEKDILVKKTGNERRKFYRKYGYIRYLVGKVGKKLVCNKCKDDIYELVSADIRDTIIDMDVD